jgi:hypothetical protein
MPTVDRRTPFAKVLGRLTLGLVLITAGVSCGSSPSPPAQSRVAATGSPLPTATPSPATSAPVQTPLAVPQGVVPCPGSTPTDQHTLGVPGGPGSRQKTMPGLDFCGGGGATLPTGTAGFLTGGNWGLGIADSCPVGSSGEGGTNTVITVTEVLPGGAAGPDTATEGGDWTDSSTTLMATGGNLQLQVTTVSPDCVWHIAIYPT